LLTISSVGALLVLSAGAFACRVVDFPLPEAGFWYESDAFVLSPSTTSRLGAPIDATERARIELVSRSEIERAFKGLRIALTSKADVFWRVSVVQSIPVRTKLQGPAAGESLPMGVLGGVGSVGFDLVAVKAIDYGSPDASRAALIDGIGRGVGRVAVHEFAHQILGLAFAHNDDDPNSYEFGRPDRSQYYGELHWTTAWPLLQERLGLRAE
jgi:hypothetical protein